MPGSWAALESIVYGTQLCNLFVRVMSIVYGLFKQSLKQVYLSSYVVKCSTGYSSQSGKYLFQHTHYVKNALNSYHV